MKFFWLSAIFFFVLINPQGIFAQEDTGQFVIRFYGAEDTTPPTTPTLTSATAVAPTQVDLVWTTATDNAMLSGYVVFRNGSPLATTTLTNYSDTGVSASSTYSYFVRAFDLSYNYSSSSNSLNVTTPNNPAPDPEAPAAQGTAARVVAEEVTVTTGISTSSIYIKTAHRARLEIRWGRTASYELGYIVTDAYKTNHRALITDLEPGTVYEYEIIGYTPFGNKNVIKQGKFRTLSETDLLPPANISGFTGIAEGRNVRLNWRLPSDVDLKSVRIVRNHLGYPSDPNDGFIVYQGLGNSVVDDNILAQHSPVYYTAFAYDLSGNISSGAVVVVYATRASDDDIVGDDYELIPINSIGQEKSTSTLSIRTPELFEINISQNGAVYTFDEKLITLSYDQPFVVSIPVHAVEKHLKSIIVTLENPTNNRETFSFLLRLNKNQTAYEGVIAPMLVEGEGDVSLSIYDYQTYIVASYEQRLSFVSPETLRDLFGPKEEGKMYWIYITFSLLLLLLIFWWIIARRRVEDKK